MLKSVFKTFSIFAAFIIASTPAQILAAKGDYVAKSGQCHFVLASRKTVQEVKDFTNEYRHLSKKMTFYKSQNNWFVITIGEVKKDIFKNMKEVLDVPSDALCSSGKAYIKQYSKKYFDLKSAGITQTKATSTNRFVKKGHCYPVLGYKNNLNDAINLMDRYANYSSDYRIYKTRNGQYAVAATGSAPNKFGKNLVLTSKENRLLPETAFCASGKSFSYKLSKQDFTSAQWIKLDLIKEFAEFANIKKQIKVENLCNYPIWINLRYYDFASEKWKIKGVWKIGAKKRLRLQDNGRNLTTPLDYVYIRATDKNHKFLENFETRRKHHYRDNGKKRTLFLFKKNELNKGYYSWSCK